MKYSTTNKPLVCMQTQSTCYKGTSKMTVKGVLWHSTAANNPWLKRYVQPSDNAPDKAEMLQILGINKNGNDWNHISREAGLNCWVGKLANGEVSTVQTMPWDFKPWGCGSHPTTKWSCNNGWIQFEICEADLNDADYFAKVYKEACEITAYLCKMFNIDPLGTVNFHGIDVPTITCHNDAYYFKHAGNHSDINHWFPKYGKNMETARHDVKAILDAEKEREEDEDMTQDKFDEMWKKSMDNYRKEHQDNDSGEWSKAARDWATSIGLVVGNGKIPGTDTPNYMWEDMPTREQLVTVLYRLCDLLDLEIKPKS